MPIDIDKKTTDGSDHGLTRQATAQCHVLVVPSSCTRTSSELLERSLPSNRLKFHRTHALHTYLDMRTYERTPLPVRGSPYTGV